MRLSLAIISTLLLAGCLGANTKPLRIETATWHEEASFGGVTCVVDGTYPVVFETKSDQNISLMNNLIQKHTLDAYTDEIQDCPKMYLELVETGALLTETNNFGFQIGFNEQGLLSFTHHSSHYLEGTAHPANSLGALTIDTVSGKIYDIASLFRPESSYKELLTVLVEWQMKMEGIFADPDVQTDFEEWIFYLRPGYLVLGNFFDVHALQAMQVAIPLDKLTEVIREDGPLQRLLESPTST
tara:strand:+ start:754 stop:1479 length:726 start_codon:yes stop_codon:yes gene_type:complete